MIMISKFRSFHPNLWNSGEKGNIEKLKTKLLSPATPTGLERMPPWLPVMGWLGSPGRQRRPVRATGATGAGAPHWRHRGPDIWRTAEAAKTRQGLRAGAPEIFKAKSALTRHQSHQDTNRTKMKVQRAGVKMSETDLFQRLNFSGFRLLRPARPGQGGPCCHLPPVRQQRWRPHFHQV